MPARAVIGRNVPRWGIAALLLGLVGCLSPHEPEPATDRVPPGQPNVALVHAHVPGADGVAWIRGAAGCVEPGVSVEVRDAGSAHPHVARGDATGAGAFEVGFPGERMAMIEVVAIDAAGNASRAALVAIGAPFQLTPMCPDAAAVAGDSLGIEAGARLTDESGAVVPGVDVSFTSGTLSPGAGIAATSADGVAVWPVTAPTRAGAHALSASVPVALLASAATCTLYVQAAAVAGVEVARGSEQVGAPAGLLADDLVCRVVDRFGNGVPDRSVDWTATDGSLSSPTSLTDAQGEASVRWTLPAVAGEWQVSAAPTATAFTATFAGIAGGPPQIDTTAPDPAASGGDLTLYGGPFSRDPVYDEVWFESGGLEHPAEILSAFVDQLQVRVPDAALSGNVHVRVCGREAGAHAVRIELGLGSVQDVPVGASLRLETPDGNEEYVVGLFTAAETSTPFQLGSVAAKSNAAAVSPAGALTGPDAFHAWLRQQEFRVHGAALARQASVAAKPMTQRTFAVLADLSGSSYTSVTATLRSTASSALIYVDDRVPASDLSDAQVNALAARFAGAGGSYGIDVNAFGSPSDVDADGRVLVLLTPAVNQLTAPGSGAYVGGFFFAQDLHDVPYSNHAEMIYTMVPDPTGRWGNVFPVQSTIDVLDGVLPHELQHAISYNQHALLRHGDPEELWLNEALSHVAEGLCGEMLQNQLRANRFLANPQLVSLTTGGNALAERGMSFLFVRFIADQEDATFLRRLVQTSRTGRDNVEQTSGRSLETWMHDWVAALYLDHADLAQEPRYRFASIDLAGDFDAPSLQTLSLEFPNASGSLQPTSCRFYRLTGTSAPYTDLSVGGARAVVIRVR